MTQNLVYFITGANRGVGLAFVQALAVRPNVTIVASVRSEAAIKSTKDQVAVTGKGSSLHFILLDLASGFFPEEVHDAFLAGTDHKIDRIDVLINNAAVLLPNIRVANTKPDQLRQAFEVNAIAPLVIYQGLEKFLKNATGAPKVINISSTLGSITGQMAERPAGAYGPSKAALNWITRALHVQNEETGLITFAFHPGYLKTDMGYQASRGWNMMDNPDEEVEDSVAAMLKVIDAATREKYSGEFLYHSGEPIPW